MRVCLLTLALILAAASGLAAEAVSLTGRVTGIQQYPQKETICLSFESKDKKTFLICDDATAKDVIEKLFALGKKDTDCRIDGTVARKNGNDVYLTITGVGQGG